MAKLHGIKSARRSLTIIGLSSHFSTFFQMYSGSVTSTGSAAPNGDSRTIRPPDDRGSLVPKARTAAAEHRPRGKSDARRWSAGALDAAVLFSGPLNSRRAPLIALSRSIACLRRAEFAEYCVWRRVWTSSGARKI